MVLLLCSLWSSRLSLAALLPLLGFFLDLFPLKFTDPTGHCATLDGGAPDLEGDAGCWDAANEWLTTFGMSGYKNVEDWQRYFAGQSGMKEENFRISLDSYWGPLYQAWGVYHKRYNPTPEMHPVTSEDQAFEQFTHKVECKNPASCVTNALDGIATGAAGTAAVCTLATGGLCAVVAEPAVAVSIVAGGIGTILTAVQVAHGDASESDLATAATTFTIGAARDVGGEAAKKVNPWIGFAASLYQWMYDNK